MMILICFVFQFSLATAFSMVFQLQVTLQNICFVAKDHIIFGNNIEYLQCSSRMHLLLFSQACKGFMKEIRTVSKKRLHCIDFVAGATMYVIFQTIPKFYTINQSSFTSYPQFDSCIFDFTTLDNNKINLSSPKDVSKNISEFALG